MTHLLTMYVVKIFAIIISLYKMNEKDKRKENEKKK